MAEGRAIASRDPDALLPLTRWPTLAASEEADESQLQSIPFDVARETGTEPRDLFRSFYEVVLGQERGPRFGSFVMLVGKDRVLEMLRAKVAA